MRKILLVLSFVASALLPPLAAAPADAAPILTVTSFDDEVNGPGDGTSLREAVSLAAADGELTLVLVPPGEYLLDRCAAPGAEDEDLNVDGDLDHPSTDEVLIGRAGVPGEPLRIVQTCAGERLFDVGGNISFNSTELTGGTPAGDGGAIRGAGDVAIIDSTVEGNTAGGNGGGIDAGGHADVARSLVLDNEADRDGGGVHAAGRASVTSSEVTGNQAGGLGGGVRALGAGDVSLDRATIAGNRASDGGGISQEAPEQVVLFTSTVAENLAVDGTGGVATSGEVITIQTAVADNVGSAGSAANVAALRLVADETVFADRAGQPSCVVGSAVSSPGWNYEEGGATCGLTDGPGDVTSGADPGLQPLFANGGRTRTMYLAPGSPLLDRAPVPDAIRCGQATSDQREVLRPQGAGCETGPVEVPPCGAVFGDVGLTHPFCWEIEWMATTGITTGFPGTPLTYQPSSPVTRQSMSAFLYRFSGSPPFEAPATPTFADVGSSHPFVAEVEWMAAEDITTGFPGSPQPTYRPSAPVSRQAMSAFMFRLGYGSVRPDEPATATFRDVGTGHPFFGEVEWMASTGVTTGFPGNLFKPGQPVTRQSMSAFLFRLVPALAYFEL
jgi:hypothetical protein